MDVQFINPVLRSVMSVFSTMAGLSPTAEKPRVRDQQQLACGAVSGVMSMVGKEGRASVALSFSEPVILDIANRMLPEKRDTIDCMVTDLVGELSNMVLGDAKRQLEEKGFQFDVSLPIVIVGKDHLIAHRSTAPVIMVPFKTDQGGFCVEASYEIL